jgi:hypothetical protein
MKKLTWIGCFSLLGTLSVLAVHGCSGSGSSSVTVQPTSSPPSSVTINLTVGVAFSDPNSPTNSILGESNIVAVTVSGL